MANQGFSARLRFTTVLSRLEPPTGPEAEKDLTAAIAEPRWAHHSSDALAACEGKTERPNLCLMCENEASDDHQCPNCKLARYCSLECKDRDASVHSRICTSYRDIIAQTRPTEHHHRTVFFPCDSNEPELVWFKAHLDSATGNLHFETDRKEVSDFVARFGRAKIWHMNLNSVKLLKDKDIAHGLDFLLFWDRKSMDLECLNRSLLSFGKPGFVSCIFGPVFLWAYDVDNDRAFLRCRDVDLRDVRHGIDCHILNSGNPAIGDLSRYGLADEAIMALKINDLDDEMQKALGVTHQMEMVPILRDHPIFDTYRIAKMFGLGLRWYIRSALPFGSQPLDDYHHHQHEELLDIFKFTVHPEFQVCETKNGTRVLVRHLRFLQFRFSSSFHLLQDNGAPIHPAHVQAAVEYFRLVQVTRGRASQRGFAAFWGSFERRAEKKGHPFRGVSSPYDVERDSLGFDRFAQDTLQLIQRDPLLFEQRLSELEANALRELNADAVEGKSETLEDASSEGRNKHG